MLCPCFVHHFNWTSFVGRSVYFKAFCACQRLKAKSRSFCNGSVPKRSWTPLLLWRRRRWLLKCRPPRPAKAAPSISWICMELTFSFEFPRKMTSCPTRKSTHSTSLGLAIFIWTRRTFTRTLSTGSTRCPRRIFSSLWLCCLFRVHFSSNSFAIVAHFLCLSPFWVGFCSGEQG